MSILAAISSVLLNAIAQLFLKSFASKLATSKITDFSTLFLALEPKFFLILIGGLSCYGFSVLLWVVALMRLPVSTAYPMISLGFVINLILAYFLFHEPITLWKIFGIFLIIVGVIVLALEMGQLDG
jgi:drug/metabolite transporter (DMT)-like permease